MVLTFGLALHHHPPVSSAILISEFLSGTMEIISPDLTRQSGIIKSVQARRRTQACFCIPILLLVV